MGKNSPPPQAFCLTCVDANEGLGGFFSSPYPCFPPCVGPWQGVFEPNGATFQNGQCRRLVFWEVSGLIPRARGSQCRNSCQLAFVPASVGLGCLVRMEPGIQAPPISWH